MKKQQLQATFEGGEVRVSLFLYIDEHVHVCYSPELDLFGYGNTEDEALRSFGVVLTDYLTYGVTNHTLVDDLTQLGWTVDVSRQLFTAPALHELLIRNTDFSQTLQNRSFRKLDRFVDFAAAA